MSKTYAIVSSWYRGHGEGGLYSYEVLDDGSLAFIDSILHEVTFNVTVVDNERGLVYAINETESYSGEKDAGGRIFTLKINPDGTLTQLGSVRTYLKNPCFIGFDKDKKRAVVSIHGGRASSTGFKPVADAGFPFETIGVDDTGVELFSVNDDGTPGKIKDVVPHYLREDSKEPVPHPHCAVFAPDYSLFATCDKGNDTLRLYKIDKENEKLLLAGGPVNYAVGTKPRYLVFHPTEKYLFHNNEHCMDLYAYKYGDDGALECLAVVDAQPEGYVHTAGVLEQQGLVISKDGKFLYDICRGCNTIAAFKIGEDGVPVKAADVPVDNIWPRGCTLTPDEKYLMVCGVDGGKVFTYPIVDGIPQECSAVLSQPNAAYISFYTI